MSSRFCVVLEGREARDRLGGVFPLCECEGCGGEVVSRVWLHGPFVRGAQVSASDDAARAPEPLGLSVKLSLPPAGFASVRAGSLSRSANVPRVRDESRFVLEYPPPMGALPHMPLDGCHVLSVEEGCEDLSSLPCLFAGVEKSPNGFERFCSERVSAR
jgi:hypothetical protein